LWGAGYGSFYICKFGVVTEMKRQLKIYSSIEEMKADKITRPHSSDLTENLIRYLDKMDLAIALSTNKALRKRESDGIDWIELEYKK
jgi:hypothetical protein